jgi:hypothetical protein
MAALLQLVSTEPALPPAILAAPHEPRVFSASFQERLAQLNRAERALRAMGLRVVWSSLTGTMPHAHIQRDANVSLAGLLERLGPRTFREEDTGKLVSGEFEGVTVSWREPK